MAHKQMKNAPKALRAGFPHYDAAGGIAVGRKKVRLMPSTPSTPPIGRKRKTGS